MHFCTEREKRSAVALERPDRWRTRYGSTHRRASHSDTVGPRWVPLLCSLSSLGGTCSCACIRDLRTMNNSRTIHRYTNTTSAIPTLHGALHSATVADGTPSLKFLFVYGRGLPAAGNVLHQVGVLRLPACLDRSRRTSCPSVIDTVGSHFDLQLWLVNGLIGTLGVCQSIRA